MHNQVSVKHNTVAKKMPPAKKPAANLDVKCRSKEPTKQCLNKHLDQLDQHSAPTETPSAAPRCGLRQTCSVPGAAGNVICSDAMVQYTT